MVLEKIHLQNFRNFHEETIVFPAQRVLRILGQNGAGKTNLLEAIFILYTTRSFRNRKTLKDCIQYGEKFFHIAAEIQGIRHGITFSGDQMEKSIFMAQQKVKAVDFIQNKSILHFSPEESHQFFLSQEYRRTLLDRYISALDANHLGNLLKFNHLRSKKVQILFSNTAKKGSLLALETPLFIHLSDIISSSRNAFLDAINPFFQHFIQIFNPKLGQSNLLYRRKRIPDDFVEKEILAQRVLYGCHRDEMDILEKGKEIRLFFSNGEKKAINLAFHFAFLEYLKENSKQDCLVCLDDIESELDQNTLKNIYGMIEKTSSQFIITSKSNDRSGKTDIELLEGKFQQA
ncbi:AAA family ATPase [Myxococcota bacterium]|nr:AAA family ATPase [Myxococcota bacterium]